MKKVSKEDFISESTKMHCGKYDYSLVNYVNSNTKVCIICPVHGEFWQRPYDHKHGKGCYACSGTKKRDTESFIDEARKNHGDKYDYSKVRYESNNKKVCIICPIHGEFWQTPHSHLSGHGCAKCANEDHGLEQKIYTKEYVLSIAEQYHTTKEFRTANATAYNMAKHYQLDLSFLKQEKTPRYTYNDVFNLAKQCSSRGEFYKKFGSAYHSAIKNRWIDSFDWLHTPQYHHGDMSAHDHVVYAYEFEEENVAYIGLTNNIKRRNKQHTNPSERDEKSAVFRFHEQCGIEIPSPIILEEELTPEEAQEAEGAWCEIYIKDGWNLLNKGKVGKGIGSLGAYIQKWTYEECCKFMAEFKDRNQLRRQYPACYKIAYVNGWLWEYYEKPAKIDYTYDYCKAECQKYKSRHELQKKDRPLYRAIVKYGWIDDFYKPLRRSYSLELCKELVEPYTTIPDLMKADFSLYQCIRIHGWLEELYPYIVRSKKNNRRIRSRVPEYVYNNDEAD